MKDLEELENICDTLSVLISEIEDKDRKVHLNEILSIYEEEKLEAETRVQVMQEEYEAERLQDLRLIRI